MTKKNQNKNMFSCFTVELFGMKREWKLCRLIDPHNDCPYEFSYNYNNRGDYLVQVNETKGL